MKRSKFASGKEDEIKFVQTFFEFLKQDLYRLLIVFQLNKVLQSCQLCKSYL